MLWFLQGEAFLLIPPPPWGLPMGVKGLKNERTLEDLKGILSKVSLFYLGRLLPEVVIQWGRYRKLKKPRKVINLGLYFWGSKVIRIHPVLRQRWVPNYFVEYVVYHEILHHVMAPEMKKLIRVSGKGKTPNYHPEVFVLAEKLFRKYDRAMRWEEKNLDRLLTA
jgi:hypothetical protein